VKKYLAYDAPNNEYESFETIEEAQKWIEESILDPNDGYASEVKDCKIYELRQIVEFDKIDSKENYEYEYEDDIPEGDETSEAWPYDPDFDEVWQHRFIDVPPEEKP